jgi:hypothetical protein
MLRDRYPNEPPTKYLDNITSAHSSNKFVCSVFVDFKKAFDKVDLTILLSKLANYGFRGHSYQYLKSYLLERHQYVQISNSKSDSKSLSHGVPQGSVLGPVLFLIYINDLPSALLHSESILFADDTTLTSQADSLASLNTNINHDLAQLSTWMSANKLTLNSDKTNYTLFFPPTALSTPLSIIINKQPIHNTTESKILGVIIDQNLTFKSHLAQIKKKLASFLFIFNQIRSKIPTQVAWHLYNAIFKSHLVYCILIWGHSCASYLHPLNVIHHRFLKSLLYLPARTPTTFVYEKASVLSLLNLYKYFASILIFKSLYFPSTLPVNFPFIFKPITQIHSHNTRASSSRNLFNQPCSTACRQNHITIQAPIIWNSIPNDIKTLQSIPQFKTQLYQHLLKTNNIDTPIT